MYQRSKWGYIADDKNGGDLASLIPIESTIAGALILTKCYRKQRESFSVSR